SNLSIEIESIKQTNINVEMSTLDSVSNLNSENLNTSETSKNKEIEESSDDKFESENVRKF
ncbi:3091_t:CDS:1, partial [Scutellospora calospora]